MTETTPSEPPQGLGNTVDGTRAGDGSDARTDPGELGADELSPEQGSGQASGHEHADQQRAGQKKVYRSPRQPDHALGGSEGTTDGS